MAISKIENNSLASGVPGTAKLPAGTVLQVVSSTFTTSQATSSTTLQDTGFSVSISPTSANSKILLFATCPLYVTENGQGATYVYGRLSLARGATQLAENRLSTNPGTTAIVDTGTTISLSYYDSPATTSSTTYKLWWSSVNFAFSSTVCWNGNQCQITAMEIAA